jgi:phosphopantetheinyl transferase (holo-ACP synthase)
MKIVPIPDHWRGRAMVISGVRDPHSFFTADELSAIAAFPRPKRQMEWMLSRIAEKELRRRGSHGEHVSFSHSAAYGAAAVDTRPVGIDVQTSREIAEGAARHFLDDEEIEAMRRCGLSHRLLHFWCAKEAAWKQRRGSVPTLKGVRIALVNEQEEGLRFDSVETIAIGDLIVALTL